MAISSSRHFQDCEKILSEVMRNAKKANVPKEFRAQRKMLLVEASARIGKKLKLQ